MSTSISEIPLHDLPLWMRQARQGVDWGILLVMAFSLCMAWSFIISPGIPITGASQNHAFMAADTAQALREGLIYPRWSPHALEGYGAPIPNYTPPGAAYTVALIEIFITSNTLIALRFVYALALCAAGAGSYAFVTRWMGSGGGLLASMLYVYNPYVGFTAPHVTGDLSGVIGLALLPILLWAVSRLLLMNRPIDMVFITLSMAAIILTDPRLILIALLTTLFMVQWYRRHNPHKHPVSPIFYALLIGIGLAAFHWIPALVEQGLIYWRSPAVPQPVYQLEFPEAFAPLRQIDFDALMPVPQFTLGWVSLTMAVLGALGIIVRPAQNLFPALFFGMGGFLLLLALTILRRETWLLGPIALYFAVGSSAALSLRIDLLKQAKQLLLPGLLIITLLGSPAVWLSPYWLNTTFDTTPKAQIEYEQQGWGVAVLTPGASVPTTLPATTQSSRLLINAYQSGGRGGISIIPPDPRAGTIGTLSQRTQEGRYRVFSDREMRVTVLLAYFPGWRAYLDNEPLIVSENRETRLMEVVVPASRGGELRIVFENTPTRTGATLFSLFAFIVLILFTLRRFHKTHSTFHDLHLLNTSEARLGAMLLLSFTVIVLLSATPSAIVPLRAQPGLIGTVPLRISTNAGLQLLAYHLDQQTIQRGESLELTLFWRAQRALPDNYRIRLTLRDVNRGDIVEDTSLRHPGGFPTRRWKTIGYVADQYRIFMPFDLLSGNYQIGIEVLNCQPDCSQNARLTFFRAGDPEGNEVFLLPQIISISDG